MYQRFFALRKFASANSSCFSQLTQFIKFLGIRHFRQPIEPPDLNLRIAFFGSDQFSIPSLLALKDLQASNHPKNLIRAIDVICRPPKRAGRGLTNYVDVAIAEAARDAGVQIIRAESKTEINNLCGNYDLAVAVSYGKLIPVTFLNSLTYGGLNVHPSLLPKYSGAAPIQNSLLNNDSHTGVTVQTLDLHKFDAGEIVLQTDDITIKPTESFESLRDRLATIGAEMLATVVRNKMFTNGVNETTIKPKHQYSYAKKITSAMKQIDWKTHTADQIVKRASVLGPLYTFKEVNVPKKFKNLTGYKRVILSDIQKINPSILGPEVESLQPGQFVDVLLYDEHHVIVRVIDGYIGVRTLQFECQKPEKSGWFMQRMKKRVGDTANQFIFRSEETKK